MQHLVDDLLYLTRGDEAAASIRREPLEVDELIREEAASLSRRTELRIDTSALMPGRMLGDRDRLARLIRTLTDNAARHAQTTVWLTSGTDEGMVVFTVADDGPGIPVADGERVFERFVRLDESRSRDTGGVGLGLAVAREIALSHGGSLRLVAPTRGGATFAARFPAAG